MVATRRKATPTTRGVEASSSPDETETRRRKPDETEEDPQFASLGVPHLVTLSCVLLCAHLGYSRLAMEADLAVEAARLNNTIGAKHQLMFFNRVPKVGSVTMKSMLANLQKRNNFTHVVDSETIKASAGERVMIPYDLQRHYVNMFMTNITPPASYSKHIAFIDFEGHERDYQPIYINFVREPVQRLISWYYYIRAPWYHFNMNKNKTAYGEIKWEYMKVKMHKTSFEDCLADPNNKECKYISGHNPYLTGEGGSHVSQMMFFCGHESHCAVINGEQAYKDAVSNVEKYYSVVGVLEEMDKSLTVLENYVPRFFAGVRQEYARRDRDHKEVNKNIYRPHVGEEARSQVRRNITREMQFYQFCKDRLHRQWLALGLDEAEEKKK